MAQRSFLGDMLTSIFERRLARPRTRYNRSLKEMCLALLDAEGEICAVHPGADLSENGLRQSSGAMVNYQYDLGQIEQNHERFVQHGEISTAPSFRAAARAKKARQNKARNP